MSAAPRPLRLLPRHGFALAFCLFACLFPSPAIAATRTVYVGDNCPTPCTTVYFSNNSGGGGGNTTTITAGDTIHWLWQGTMSHDTKSGVCSPGCVANGIWSSTVQISGTFDHTFFNVGSFPYYCSVHGSSQVGTIVVNPGPADHFVVSAPASVGAGSSFSITVTAYDAYGNIATGFGGTVSFSSSDAQATLPGSGILFSGSRTFSGVVLRTSNSQSITASSGGVTPGTAFVTVTPGPATHMGVSAPPSASTGLPFNITVTALDQFNNRATSYAGTVHFTSSDVSAVKPADSTLSSGLGIFPFTLNTVGTQSITATDTITSSISGSTNVTVKPPCPAAPKTFSNNSATTFSSTGFGGVATTNPFPSQINVSGITGTIGKLTLTLNGLTDLQCSADLAFLLQGPHGQFMIPMSLVGPCPGAVNNVTLTLDDAAASPLPGYPAALASGTYRPASYYAQFSSFGPMSFKPPAPAGPYTAAQLAATDGTARFANIFNGTDPNGTWNLYVMYQPQIGGFSETSTLAGWGLTITPQFPTPSATPIPIPISGPGAVYPSTIAVSGLPGHVTKVTVTLNNFTSTCQADPAFLLVGPQGQNLVLDSESGGCTGSGATVSSFTLDDAVSAQLPAFSFATPNFGAGIYRPTSNKRTVSGTPPVFTGVAGPYNLPAPDGSATFASVFNGADPNGNWKLYALTQFNVANSSLDTGWSVNIQTDCPAGTSCSVGSNVNPSVFGQAVTFTATVTSGSGTPFGNVTFQDNGSSLGGGSLSGGMATLNTSALAVGTHPITVNYAGNTTFAASTSATLNEVVNAGVTATVVGTSGSPSIFGTSVTFTATVTVTPPAAGTPTGIVTFKDGASTLGTGPLSGGGTATFSTTSLSVGGHSITAVYGGDGNFASSTSSVITQNVNQGTTTASVNSSGSPSVFGNPVAFTATITVTSGAGTPTGTVTFNDGATMLGTGAVSGGTATFTTSLPPLPAGSHSITAVYAGDANFVGSTSAPFTQNVNRGATTTAVGTSGSPSGLGNPVMFTATVAVASGQGTPTGTVTFKDGATTLGPGTLSGVTATYMTSSLSAGSHSITAVYAGDGSFNGSTSPPITQIVAVGSSTTVLVSVPNPSGLGQNVTLTATVTGTSITPIGTVTFKDGATNLGVAPVNSGVATFTTRQWTIGTHSVTAVYSGDINYTGSTSNVLLQRRSPEPVPRGPAR